MQDDELTPQEKAAKITFDFVTGAELTTIEVARQFDITYHGARRLLCGISRVVPLTNDEFGKWKLFEHTM